MTRKKTTGFPFALLRGFPLFSRRAFLSFVPLLCCSLCLSCAFVVRAASFPSYAGIGSTGSVSYGYAPQVYSPGVSAGFVCHAGQTCAEDLGDGARLYFDYAHGSGNPYGAQSGALLVSSDGRVEARFSTRRDLAGRVTQERTYDSSGSERETTDRYDALGRLIGRDGLTFGVSSDTERFSYDANGNAVLERSSVSVRERYVYDGLDRQVGGDGASFSGRYDMRGDRLYDADGTRYGYDDATHTIRVEPSHGLAYRFRAWPGGLRAVKSSSGEALDYYWTGDLLADARNTETGRVSHYLLAGARAWRAVTDASGRLCLSRYAVENYAGSVVAETSGGTRVSTRSYSAYGRPLSGKGSEAVDPLDLARNPFGFDGEYQDAETEGVYLRSREYDARGRFTSQDSLQTLNRYAAMDEDPVNEQDPDGHLPALLEARLEAFGLTGAFKYAGLLSAYSLMWQGGAMSERDLGYAFLTTAAGFVPFVGAGAADAIQQLAVEQGEWDWGRFAGAAAVGLVTDAVALGVTSNSGRRVNRKRNYAKKDKTPQERQEMLRLSGESAEKKLLDYKIKATADQKRINHSTLLDQMHKEENSIYVILSWRSAVNPEQDLRKGYSIIYTTEHTKQGTYIREYGIRSNPKKGEFPIAIGSKQYPISLTAQHMKNLENALKEDKLYRIPLSKQKNLKRAAIKEGMRVSDAEENNIPAHYTSHHFVNNVVNLLEW